MQLRSRSLTKAILLWGGACLAIAASQADTTVGGNWKEIDVVVSDGSANPFPRASFAAASDPGKSGNNSDKGAGWIFGGVVDDFTPSPIYNNDLYKAVPKGNSLVFTEITTGGAEPTERAFPSLAVVDDGGAEDVYLFGGGTFPFDLPFPASDKFWRYDSDANSWTDLTALGGPSARMGVTLIAHDESLYVFGGIAFHPVFFFELFNDLWRFDIPTQTWTQLSNGVGPQARHMAMGATIDNGQLLIYGGERVEIDFTDFSITFPIDTTTWTWDIANSGWSEQTEGPLRNYSAFGDAGDSFIIFGGDAPGGETCSGSPFAQNTSNDTYTYDSESGWQTIDAGKRPAEVKRGQGFVIKNKFYALGGFDFTCEEGQVFNMKVHRIIINDYPA